MISSPTTFAPSRQRQADWLSDLGLERTLQISIVLMASLGTIVLGLGQRSVLLPAVAVLVAVSSLYFTDILGWFRLNRNIANIAAIIAVLVSVSDFFRLERDSQLLAIANLLIYLQIVLMYQKKETRIYWQLLMLSLLQVVVAAALNFGLTFGWLLLLYLLIGLFALALFYAFRERQRLCDAMVEAPSKRSRRARRSERSAIQIVNQTLPREQEMLGKPLAWAVFRQALVTLSISLVLFFLIPRIGKEAWSQGGPRVQSVVGFNDSVELGTLGSAFQDPTSVMRVWFSDADTNQTYPVQGDPLFRGAVLNEYEDGRWRYIRQSSAGEALPLPMAPDGPGKVIQNVTLLPLNEDTVFAIAPSYRVDASERTVRYDEAKEQLVRLARLDRIDFRLATFGFDSGMQRQITMRQRPLLGIDELQLWQLPEAVGEPFPELARVARQVVAEANIAPDDIIGKANALEAHFLQSDDYEYSLDGVRRDPNLDPIEDFMSNNRQGHCEYFSTALTLMLRSQRVPARMAVGFKGGEFNRVGAFYNVRQLHAHSWVEVYLSPEQVPAAIRDAHLGTNHGAWVRLDPTPAGSDELEGGVSLRERMRQYAEYSDYLWSNYVVGLDSKTQRETIYQPVSETISGIFSPAAWKARWQAMTVWWTEAAWPWVVANATGWRGVVALLFAVMLLTGLGLITNWCWRRFSAWLTARRNTPEARRARTIEFYQRLELILARQGIHRAPHQTQHEFAVAVGGNLADAPRMAPLASLPRKIADAFYRVRFGDQPLEPAEEAKIENALSELSRAMSYRQ